VGGSHRPAPEVGPRNYPWCTALWCARGNFLDPPLETAGGPRNIFFWRTDIGGIFTTGVLFLVRQRSRLAAISLFLLVFGIFVAIDLKVTMWSMAFNKPSKHWRPLQHVDVIV
jgi:hypothetical protein